MTAFLFLHRIIFIISGKKELSCENCIEGNHPPIAITGPNQVVTLPTDSVSLDGSTSSDPRMRQYVCYFGQKFQAL